MLKEIGIQFPINKGWVQQNIISEFLDFQLNALFSSIGFTTSKISAWGFAVAPTTSFVVSPLDCSSAALFPQPAAIPTSSTKQHNSAKTFLFIHKPPFFLLYILPKPANPYYLLLLLIFAARLSPNICTSWTKTIRIMTVTHIISCS